ncbi:hypothetical protein [Ochrobactrum sp. CGA5]|uniref:hypothetical protein n=1 Tax=Ochrobactrum sp. CGA5 TaxID=2583453 RepID=UPI00111D747C|nr:hypothetical protein [Ochrobactrum sp. CGA5]
MNKNPQKPTPAPIHEQPIYDRNPSVPVAGQITKQRRAQIGNERSGMVIDEGSGEILGHGGAMIYKFEEVDKERFVKLYLDGLKSAVGMSKAGMAVFEMVYDQVRENKERDYVLLGSRTAGMSQPQFSRGLRELLDRQFLYRSAVAGMFWVNIKFMFNGNRLAFVKAYQIKGTGQQLDLLAGIDESAEDTSNHTPTQGE